jgi:putative membrane protein
MVRDHEAVNKQALALLDKLKVKPEDNDTSKSLADAASKKRDELYQLDGTAFDKAYAENEVTCPSSEYLRQKAAGFSGGRGSSDG